MCRERCGIDLGYVVVSRTSKALGGALHIAPRNVAVDYRAVKPAERIPMVGDDVDGGCFNTQFFQVVKPPFAGRNKTQACEDCPPGDEISITIQLYPKLALDRKSTRLNSSH